jgi:hypothetical protein
LRQGLPQPDRVYLPQDALAAHGATIEMLAQESAPPLLLATIRDLNEKTGRLLAQSRPFADLIDDTRLAMEVGAIQTLAEQLVARLAVADPLRDKVHDAKFSFALKGAVGALGALLRRISRPRRADSEALPSARPRTRQ